MRTELFDYPLPTELIAHTPCERRDQSRLLVVDRVTRRLAHHRFCDLPRFLRPGDTLFRNTARVLPARLLATRPGGGRVECLLLRPDPSGLDRWWCLLRPGKKLPPGAVFGIADGFDAEVLVKSPTAEYLVRFSPARVGETVPALAERLGAIPLPPYIDPRREARGVDDRNRYQTVFADPARTVAVAAPTAGLHFTPELLAAIEAGGARFADLVLHVGLATFKPIDADDVSRHRIHRESYEIPASTRALLDAPSVGRRIAVGTTSVRALEAYARSPDRTVQGAFHAEAGLYLHPPAEFMSVDALVTNFHLPRSTLLCLVASFLAPGGVEGVAWLREIYAEAIRERYRFLSYGDAMLVL